MPFSSPLRSRLLTLAVLLVATATGSGCDRVKSALHPDTSDPQWQNDSTVLAAKPTVLLRVSRDTAGRERIQPMATIGEQGFRQLSLGNRGWRAFDVTYLQSGSKLAPVHQGVVAGDVEMRRGMWEPPAVLDTFPAYCNVVVPAGRADVSPDTWLLTAGPRPALKPVEKLADGELQQALSTVPTLVAPTSGIGTSMLTRYTREVHVLNSGTGKKPSILVSYNDPESLPDSVAPIAQRPRQLIVILDRGVYGYRPSYKFSTVGNVKSPWRMQFLDYLDVDGDGQAELFFGVRQFPAYTIILRFENESWREMLKFTGQRCFQ